MNFLKNRAMLFGLIVVVACPGHTLYSAAFTRLFRGASSARNLDMFKYAQRGMPASASHWRRKQYSKAQVPQKPSYLRYLAATSAALATATTQEEQDTCAKIPVGGRIARDSTDINCDSNGDMLIQETITDIAQFEPCENNADMLYSIINLYCKSCSQGDEDDKYTKDFYYRAYDLLEKHVKPLYRNNIVGERIKRSPCACCQRDLHLEVNTKGFYSLGEPTWKLSASDISRTGSCHCSLILYPSRDRLRTIVYLAHGMVMYARLFSFPVSQGTKERLSLERFHELETMYLAMRILQHECFMEGCIAWYATSYKSALLKQNSSTREARMQVTLHAWIKHIMKRDQKSQAEARNYVAQRYKELIDLKPYSPEQRAALEKLVPDEHMPTLEQLLWSVVSSDSDGSAKSA